MTIIKIDKPVKVSEIKKAFNNEFPFLKIEFFKKKHKELQGSLKKDVITDDFVITAPSGGHDIIISEDMLVSEFEKQFAEKLKLSAQVLENRENLGWKLLSQTVGHSKNKMKKA